MPTGKVKWFSPSVGYGIIMPDADRKEVFGHVSAVKKASLGSLGIEHARRMGWMCDRVVEAGGTAIADFISPTEQTRAAFGIAFTIWVDRITAGRFDDTNRMFVSPAQVNLRVDARGTPQYWAERALELLRPSFDPQRPTALFVGRYQPFHIGHQRLIEEGLRRVGQVCIAVRNTHGINVANPLPFFCGQTAYRNCLGSLYGSISSGGTAKYHKRILWTRRRLLG